jgi:predicted nucleotidyltransferase/Zn-dependent peptidase ImmA (M78 family)/transcriptional regulator with XRE-family HTH domain
MLTPELLGERLKDARKRVGYSQQEIAEELDMSRSAVSKIESGQQNIDSIQLRVLSGLYGVNLSDLLAEPGEEIDQPAFVQALRQMGDKNEIHPRDIKKVEEFCEYYQWLKEEVGGVTVSLPSEREKQAAREAKELRGRWELGHAPVDLFLVLQEHGYDLVRWPMESDISGCLANVPGIGPVIFVNTENRTLGHQVFSSAHELYHLLNGFDQQIRLEHINREGKKTMEEKAADRFAVEFLLPGPGLSAGMEEIDVIGKDLEPAHVVRLQMRFGVSYECMVNRLKNLGFISGQKRKNLLDIQPVKLALQLGYEDREIFGEKGSVFPKRFRALAVKALTDCRISPKKFMELMNIDEKQFWHYAGELDITDDLIEESEPMLEEVDSGSDLSTTPVQSCEEIIQRIQQHGDLFEQYDIDKFVLFGSAVQGELSSDSDIDMVVFAENITGYWSLTELRLKLEEILGREVDLATKPMVEHLWDKEIRQQGVELRAA